MKEVPAVISDAAAEALRAYAWPGNVRELRNAIEHAFLLSNGDEILPDTLPEDLGARPETTLHVSPSASANGGALNLPLTLSMDEVEKRYILAVYEKARKNKTLAAKNLGIGLKTLYRKLVKYGEMSPSEGEADE
jgi:DNA-binding NtrC family response regulator